MSTTTSKQEMKGSQNMVREHGVARPAFASLSSTVAAAGTGPTRESVMDQGQVQTAAKSRSSLSERHKKRGLEGRVVEFGQTKDQPRSSDLRSGQGEQQQMQQRKRQRSSETGGEKGFPDTDQNHAGENRSFLKSKSGPKPGLGDGLQQDQKRGQSDRSSSVNGTSLGGHERHGSDGNGSGDMGNNRRAKGARTGMGVGKGQETGSYVSPLKQKSERLLLLRQKLPIWQHKDEISRKMGENDVLLLVGETGSGKSTQVPQFLLDANRRETSSAPVGNKGSGKRGNKNESTRGTCVAITQPRRVAAISLAKRVAEEMATPLGSSSPAAKVGYSVRFDNNTGPSTQIKYLTEGMLLQETLQDPELRQYSHILVDEVHERSVNVDLVLGLLKNIINQQDSSNPKTGLPPPKLVIMSATADMDRIRNFFSPSPSDSHRPVAVDSCFIKGRQFPVRIQYTPKPIENILDAAMERIIDLHTHSSLPGDILVFLSGQEMIENLESLCQNYSHTIEQQQKPLPQSSKHAGAKPKTDRQKLPRLSVLPLYAALPTHLQQRVFQPAAPFTRKVILSTNIAETSVTVAGVRHVIDTGKHKSRRFRPGLNLDTLLTTAISRSSAAQRAGRAGREAPGTCFRLYTEEKYLSLTQDTPAEILQTDLSAFTLTLKSRGINDISSFSLLTPPPPKNLHAAYTQLLSLQALDPENGSITETGRQMSYLPLRPQLACILLSSALPQFNCVDEIVDIVAGLSLEEGIWLPLHEKGKKHESGSGPILSSSTNETTSSDTHTKGTGTENLFLRKDESGADGLEESTNDDDDDDDDDDGSAAIRSARRTLFRREGDHLTLLAAIQAYSGDDVHDRKEWCRQHAVSHRAMSKIMDVRKQLSKLMSRRVQGRGQDKIEPDHVGGDNGSLSTYADLNSRVLKCLLTGLWTNVARLSSAATSGMASSTKAGGTSRGQYTTLLTSQPLNFHPSSVLFTFPSSSSSSSSSSSVATNQHRQDESGSGMPEMMMFTEIVYTTKPYARNCSAILPEWLEEIVG